MHISRHHKNGFTVIEVLVALVATGIGVLAIMEAIQANTRIMTMTRSQVIATNLAREGIEAVFNKRDTNRLLFPSKKDQCRLANSTSSTGTNCENDARFGSRLGPDGWEIGSLDSSPVLRGMTSQNDTQSNGPFKFHPVATTDAIEGFFNNNFNPKKNLVFKLNARSVSTNLDCLIAGNHYEEKLPLNEFQVCLVNGKRGPCGTLDSSCNWTPATGAQINTKYGQFRRYITTQGIIKKDVNSTNLAFNCVRGSTADCGDSSPKELRFCSIVDYVVDNSARRVELCSVITNFAK